MTADWLTTLMPPEVYFLIFALEAVVCGIFGIHALIVARRRPRSADRRFAVALALLLILSVVVDKVFFALAFYVGAAILTGVGLVIFLPGLVAVGLALWAWMALIGDGS